MAHDIARHLGTLVSIVLLIVAVGVAWWIAG
jgi:hypothetical protein